MIERLGIWREATENPKFKGLTTTSLDDGSIQLEVTYDLPPVKSVQIVKYTVYGDGRIDVMSSVNMADLDLPILPRFGMKWELPVNFENLTYFGRGPHENYIDRKSGAFVGFYEGKVADQYFKYVRPQENGYKTDVRWFELKNENGVGFRVSGTGLIGFSALHNPVEDFDQVTHEDLKHTNDIVKKDGVFVNADLQMMGVGVDDSWGAKPYAEYSIPAADYQFNFTLEPVF